MSARGLALYVIAVSRIALIVRCVRGCGACAVSAVPCRPGGVCLSGCTSELYLVYFEKIRVFKAGPFRPLNTLAWDNRIGHEFYFVGFVKLE